MSRSPPSNQYRNHHSPKTLHRRPIHDIGIDDSDAEISEDDEYKKNSPQNNKVYPDLPDKDDIDIEKLLQQSKSFKSDFKGKDRPKKFVKREKPATEETSSSIFKYFIYVLCLIAFCLVGWFNHQNTDGPKERVAELDVMKLIGDMRHHFKEQQPETFKLLRLALKKVVNVEQEPRSPAIITLIVNEGAKNTAREFAEYLAEALAPGKYVSINESTSWNMNPDSIKLKIDEKIKSKFERDRLNVVIVDELHNIPVDAAMIFHGYCDHESAPYKRAVYLFIVYANETIPEGSNSKHIDAAAMDGFRRIWHSATDDAVDSLITRLTVTVISIR